MHAFLVPMHAPLVPMHAFLVPGPGLLPLSAAGAVVGASLVYGIEEGDMRAAEKKWLPRLKKAVTKAHRWVEQ